MDRISFQNGFLAGLAVPNILVSDRGSEWSGDVGELISADADNALIKGGDDKLYVPESELPASRDFSENPIDLETEVTGVLPIDKVDTSSLFSGDYNALDNKPSISSKISEFTLLVSAWKASSKFENYKVTANIAIENLAVCDLAQVIFDIPSVLIANKAHVLTSGETIDGAVTVYAKEIPTGNLSGCCLITKRGEA